MAEPVTMQVPKPASSRSRRSSGIVVPHSPSWYQRLAAWFIFLLIKTVTATLRCRWDDRSDFLNQTPPQPVIFCVWHNRLALSMTAYYGYARRNIPTKGLAVMVSASKDGAFLSAILDCFKVHPIRGSSSRRGGQALLELTTWAEQGYDLAITPDGPRGPCYQVQYGVTSLAQVTGLPIIPVSYDVNWKFRVNSWDRFVIPLPFARCRFVYGKPLRVPREAADEERERLRLELESKLKEITAD